MGADYLPAKRRGDSAFVSGHGPLKLERIGVVEGSDEQVRALVDVMLLAPLPLGRRMAIARVSSSERSTWG